MPTIAPRNPIANASTTTVRRIWPREAPSVRSIPNSVIRWATVIEKVLKIRKAPTKIATKAKTSSIVCRKPRLSRISSEPRSEFSSPVSTRTEGGISRSIRRFSTGGETPSSAATMIWSNSPSLSVIRCASGSVTWAMLVPPIEASPSRVKPTRRKLTALVRPTSWICSPSSRSEVLAAASSIEASVGPRGGCPSM